jgi:hypothetical protein
MWTWAIQLSIQFCVWDLFCSLGFLPCSRKNIFMFTWCCQSSNHWNLGLSKTFVGGILVVIIKLRLVSWRKGSMELEVVGKVFMGSVVVHAQRFVVQLQKILVQESVKHIWIVLKEWQPYGHPFVSPKLV